MAKKSAGILIYRLRPGLEVFLVHPGGPFWKNKDAGAWSIPKGEFSGDEDPLAAAIREVQEETGLLATGHFLPLRPVKLKSGKQIYAWAHENDFDPGTLTSNTCQIQWPPGTGKLMAIPEVDKADWFSPEQAEIKINAGQKPFIAELKNKLRYEE